MKALTKLGQRRYDPRSGYTSDQARELAALSRLISRQIALIIDRQGRVDRVVIGDAAGVVIPKLDRERAGGRLRGVRMLHTHLGEAGLSREDLMDLLFLRLDSMCVLTVDEWGGPLRFQYAHLLPGRENSESQNEPYRVSPLLPWEESAEDFSALVSALEDEFLRLDDGTVETAAGKSGRTDPSRGDGTADRAILISVSRDPRSVQEEHLAELTELARTAGLIVAGTMTQRVATIQPRHILGETKLAELEVMALQGRASVIVFDGELTPAQLQYVAGVTERKVLDRTQLILDIFAQHAVTGAGRLQIEMAQLKYTLPRLSGRNQNRAMDRLMGCIGGRGSGETKLETDRRRVRDRISRIKDELEELRRHRAVNRNRRKREGLPVAALVGYTNSGKSTMLNRLTGSEVPAENKLFATLDPTTRRLRFPRERELVLADTVGFIRDLPDELTEAFRATLEELDDADLLIHVADASHPDFERQIEAVENILADLKLQDVPRLLLLNKRDAAGQDVIEALLERFPDAIAVSGATGEGLGEASARIEKLLFSGARTEG